MASFRSRITDAFDPWTKGSAVAQTGAPAGENAAAPTLTTAIGTYRLRDRLAYLPGWVYPAEDAEGEVVLVKMSSPPGKEPSDSVARELRALQALQMEGVPRLIDQGELAGRLFLVLENKQGERFPDSYLWPEVLRRAQRLLDIVAGIHERGIVHCDLNPTTVLVDARGEVTDTEVEWASGGSLGDPWADVTGFGNPSYLAPERLQGEAFSAPTDVYAVGLMLYEALTGRLPHGDVGGMDMIRARMRREPPPMVALAPELPDAVGALVLNMLSRAPGDRPGAAEASAALKALSG